jgi:hypothetical protein
VLSKDDDEAVTRCCQFATIAHFKGHHVVMFFIDGGVTWADRNRDLGKKQRAPLVVKRSALV